YQSQSVKFTEWISLLTLCLAPLIAHIIAGVPTPIYLSRRRPVWHSLLGHFNPTSILWRYFVITDRRARAKRWRPIDMAASCALFWTRNGWDGSEEMMLKSRELCTRAPSLRRISFTSISAATTLIVTIQGVQSVYSPMAGFFNGDFAFSLAFNSIFSSIAFLGLMRLPAAFWLTNDYSYMDIDRIQTVMAKPGSASTLSAVGLLNLDYGLSVSPEEIFHPSNSWRSMLIRMIFLIPLIGSVALSAASIAQPQPGYGLFFTGTFLTLTAFYLVLIIGVIVIVTVYFWTGNTSSTVLPCIESTWYKVYTGLLIVLMIIAMVVSGLETRKSKCGIYTTFRPYYDQFGCAGT
ncbi:hypothetical protein DL95DRAFT_489333, partial [Leptodontidium sp. 2 PMI_412]